MTDQPDEADKQAMQVAQQEKTALATVETNPFALMSKLIDKGGTVEQMRAMMDLMERHDAHKARKAFFVDLTAFKSDPPELLKNKHVAYKEVAYDHVTLDAANKIIGDALANHNLCHRWECKQLEGGIIEVTCILSHALGHSERTTLRSMPDATGSKNAIQSVGSAVSYLQRYTLLAATGLAAKGMDTDGKPPGETIKEDQLVTLTEWIEQAYPTIELQQKFMAWLKAQFGVESTTQIQSKDYQKIFGQVKRVAEQRKVAKK